TSDLGAPITEDSFSAGWTGMLSINGTSKGFTLTVVFNGNANTVDGFVIDAMGAKDFLIDGDFTDNGVITGTTNFAQYTGDVVGGQIIGTAQSGILSGLIGADGAVAVFTSTATGDAGYAGGFIATPDPQVSFADWTGSFFAGGFNDTQTLLDSGADATGFVANTASFITLNDADKIILRNHATPIDPTILRLNDTQAEMGYESGIAFWHGDAGAVGSQTSQYYAGLLPTTDLGAPLTDDTKKDGTWIGTIAGITNGDVLTNTEVRFRVAFGEPTSFPNSVGSFRSIRNQSSDYTYAEGGGLVLSGVNVPATNSTDQSTYRNTFNFFGGFNAQGVITGTVAHINSGQTGTANGVFNGLIGINGAVGVFKSDDAQPYSFIGGFVATPPAE
ncbi:MAG: hypothetical protein K8953_06820, partial [Proteobacteria bacterium]|nr:hypothetical protein [Pseudomonadota bacterium]